MAITQAGDTTVISAVSVPGDAGPAMRAESVQGAFMSLPAGTSGPPTTTNLPLTMRREGILVYTPGDGRSWRLTGGTADVNWVEEAGGSGSGGFTVDDNAARDAIPTALRSEGMVVYSKLTKVYYSLDSDLTTWRAIDANPELDTQSVWYINGSTGDDD